MKLVNVDSLKGGEVLAKDVFCEDGVMLLKQSTRIRQAFKNQLLERNIQEVFISDDMTDSTPPTPLVSERTRALICSELKKQFEIVKNKVLIDATVLNEITAMLLKEIPVTPAAYDILDIHINDESTYQHSITVSILSALVCRNLKLPADLTHEITVGALMHDVGKMIIPNDILNKPSRLSNNEYEIIKSHTSLGYQMIKDYPDFSLITKLVVLCHHEREDGSGYPLGKSHDLHIGPKIVAACDILDALITDRAYRKAVPLNQALMMLRGEKISSDVRKSLENLLEFYPVDSMVLLNTGEIAIVESNQSTNIKCPKVRTVYNLKDTSYISKRIDLTLSPETTIVRKLDINETLNKIIKNEPFLINN